MLKKFKTLSLYVATVLVFGGVLVPATVSAQLFDNAKNQACDVLNQTNGQTPGDAQGADKCGTANGTRVTRIIADVINILSLIVGIAAVIMIIISGFKYITSQGDSTAVNSAKNTLLYAIVGIVIVAMAQIIVQFVLFKTDPRPAPNTVQTPVQLQ